MHVDLTSRPGFWTGCVAARKITRGPKPEQALRELELKSDLRAETPTTDGLIATLSALDLRDRKIGVQLYPGAPEARFTGFLRDAGQSPIRFCPMFTPRRPRSRMWRN